MFRFQLSQHVEDEAFGVIPNVFPARMMGQIGRMFQALWSLRREPSGALDESALAWTPLKRSVQPLHGADELQVVAFAHIQCLGPCISVEHMQG